MKEPRLHDFSLTQEDVSKLEKYDRKVLLFTLIPILILGASGGIYEAIYVEKITSPIGLAFYGFLTTFFAGLPLALVFLYVVFSVLRVFSSKHKRFSEFQKAKKEFEEWFVRTQVQFWQSLSGKQFEYEFAFLLSRNGYKIEKLAKGSGDKGVDIVAFKDEGKVIVQCKAHKAPVGPGVARDLYGTLVNEKANRAILASISGFTKGVTEFTDGKPIELIDLNQIIRLSTKEQIL